MPARPSAITAPLPFRSAVGDRGTGLGDKALGGRDRREGVMIAAMVILLIVQAALLIRMVMA